MKNLIIGAVLAIGVASPVAMAKPAKRTPPQRLCDWFQAKEDNECAHIMCDDDIANGTYKDLDDCTSADDYAEAAQGGCDGQDTTVEKLEAEYNRKHGTHIKCEQ